MVSIFSNSLIQVGIFGGIQNNLKILGSACVSWLPSSVIKVQPHFFEKLYFLCYIAVYFFLENFKACKLGMGFLGGLNFGLGMFQWGFAGSL